MRLAFTWVAATEPSVDGEYAGTGVPCVGEVVEGSCGVELTNRDAAEAGALCTPAPFALWLRGG